jgi:hypothetical protein
MRGGATRERLALALAVIAFLALPVSYAWVLNPGRNPPWLPPVIAVAEWGGLACAVAAIWLAFRSRAPVAVWAKRIALGAILIYLAAFIALSATYRD